MPYKGRKLTFRPNPAPESADTVLGAFLKTASIRLAAVFRIGKFNRMDRLISPGDAGTIAEGISA